MADIEKVHAGDTLRIEAKVNDVWISGDYPVEVRQIAAGPVWLHRSAVEAAEHIPAPKVFKRGDWVRSGSQRGGLVYGLLHNPRTVYEVSWPDGTVSGKYAQDLEHDEAPE